MVRRITKREALQIFRENWQDVLRMYPHYKGDTIAKREEWNNFVDTLERQDEITRRQCNNWTNPF